MTAHQREVQRILQSMLDHLDGIPPLKREVMTEHLIPKPSRFSDLCPPGMLATAALVATPSILVYLLS